MPFRGTFGLILVPFGGAVGGAVLAQGLGANHFLFPTQKVLRAQAPCWLAEAIWGTIGTKLAPRWPIWAPRAPIIAVSRSNNWSPKEPKSQKVAKIGTRGSLIWAF